MATPVSAVVSFTEALGVVGLADRATVYWAARATLVRRPEDIEPFDRAFRAFFDQDYPPADDEAPPPIEVTLELDDDEGGEGDAVPPEPHDDDSITLRFSVAEVLRRTRLRRLHRRRAGGGPPMDGAVAGDRLAAALVAVAPCPPGDAARRPAPHGAGGRAHPRRSDACATSAEPATRYRRLVLLLDVSGSMEPYARALLRFVQAAVAGRRRVEAFALGTRLTRITRELGAHDPDVALARAATTVQDWSGGTRLGAGLAAFNDRWGVRGMARGADVVILSDGWDRGDPEQLAEQMIRLRRVAHRIVWVNPLKVTPGYAPLARGMAAALPHVDEFVEGHSLEALERLTAVLNE